MKDIEKYASTLNFSEKIEKKMVSTSRNMVRLKLDFPQISVIFSISRKKTWNKKILFPVDQKLVFTSRNEGLADR